jgi:hypothetical protein
MAAHTIPADSPLSRALGIMSIVTFAERGFRLWPFATLPSLSNHTFCFAPVAIGATSRPGSKDLGGDFGDMNEAWPIHRMLFSFRSRDAGKYPRLLNVQTIAMAFDEKGVVRLIKQGLARYDESEDAVIFTEFEKPKVQVIGSASEWPDVIGCEHFTEHPIMVSQRVVTAFQQHGITGCQPKAVEVIKKASRRLDVRTAPQYYFLEVTGRIGVTVPGYTERNEVEPDLAGKLAKAWDGPDVFGEPPSELGRWALFCSEKVFELARTQRWTNCGFQPLHYFAPFHRRYLHYKSGLPLPALIDRYVTELEL